MHRETCVQAVDLAAQRGCETLGIDCCLDGVKVAPVSVKYGPVYGRPVPSCRETTTSPQIPMISKRVDFLSP